MRTAIMERKSIPAQSTPFVFFRTGTQQDTSWARSTQEIKVVITYTHTAARIISETNACT